MDSKILTLSRSCAGVKRYGFSPATAAAQASKFSVTVSVGWNVVTSRGAFVPLQTVTIVGLPWSTLPSVTTSIHPLSPNTVIRP
jgi:hypothetical protein